MARGNALPWFLDVHWSSALGGSDIDKWAVLDVGIGVVYYSHVLDACARSR